MKMSTHDDDFSILPKAVIGLPVPLAPSSLCAAKFPPEVTREALPALCGVLDVVEHAIVALGRFRVYKTCE